MGSGGSRKGLMRALAMLAVAIVPGTGILASGAMAAECRPDTVDLRWPGGKARFTVEVADTPETQQLGLMYRAQMPRSAGMLFVFEQPKRASFWMRNTLIPLDMLFADSTGRVTRIHENAVPHDETAIDGGQSVKLVLEINGGLSTLLRLPEGAEMRHPAIAQDTAAWPCD